MNKKFFGLFLAGAALFSVCTLESCKDTSDDLIGQIQSNYGEISAAKANIAALQSTVATLQGQLTTLEGRVGANEAAIAAAKTRLDAAEAAIAAAEERLAAAEERLDATDAAIEDINEDLAAVAEELEAINTDIQTLVKLPTGITVQQVYSTAFGSYNGVLGTHSNVLMSYYGTLTKGFHGLENDVVSPAAGKLYVTVDPTDVDFTGAEVKLVNSKGESTGVTLTPLAKSEDVLTLGFTRAEGTNYLYETTACVEDLELVDQFDLDKTAFKEVAKDLMHNKQNADFSHIAKVLYEAVSQTMVANAVELDVETELATEYYKRAILSRYEIANVAVKPLTFDVMNALAQVTPETLEKVETKALAAANKLVPYINKALDKAGYGKAVAKLSSYIGSMKFNVTPLGNITITINTGDLGLDAMSNPVPSSPQTLTIPASDFGSINALLGDVDNLNEQLDRVQALLARVSVLDNIRIPGRAESAVEKINNLVAKGLHAVAKVANPIMLVQDGEELIRLSRVAALPTTVSSKEIEFFASSYSNELIVPFFAKALVSEQAEVTAEFPVEEADEVEGAVFTGKRGTITLGAGVNELTYEVVDFAGNKKTVTYYVQVAE